MNDPASVPSTVPSRMQTAPTWLIGRLSAHSRQTLTESFAELGIRPYHYRILAALDEWGPVSQTKLGRSTSLDRSDIVGALHELTEMALVSRTPDPAHGRRNIVSLTSLGASRIAEFEYALDRAQQHVLANLTAPERAQFLELLAKLVPNTR